jgi:predicted DCC family thiol-disulfide oxidoreductase YuxK
MRPILLYDGHCNFCIQITKILEIINKNKIRLVAFQSANALINSYHLSEKNLKRKIHLISPSGQIYQGGDAVAELAQYFPSFKIFFTFFKTNVGKKMYLLVAKNRFKIFGCSNACYISKYS